MNLIKRCRKYIFQQNPLNIKYSSHYLVIYSQYCAFKFQKCLNVQKEVKGREEIYVFISTDFSEIFMLTLLKIII